MSDESKQPDATAATEGEWASDVLKTVDSTVGVTTDAPVEAVESAEAQPVNGTTPVAAETTETIVIETTETVEVVKHIEEQKEEQDKDAIIAALHAQVANLTEKIATLEAKLALNERAAEANAAPKLVHANKGRAAPRRVKVATTTESGDEQDTQANSDAAASPVPQQENAEPEETTTPQQEARKKIANMGGVSMFGGAAGFNPFANGASPTNVLLKSRSSVTSGAGGASGPSKSDIADALAKFDEVRDWVATSLGEDEAVKNSTSATFYSEILKDGSILCRLVSTLFPSHAVKFKPGKFLFIHKENLTVYQLSKITLISHVDAVFDMAEAIVTGSNAIDSENYLVLKRTSEFGIFVRRAVLDYRTLNFKEVSAFFENVCELRNHVLEESTRLQPGKESMDVDGDSKDAVFHDTVTLIYADRYLDAQVGDKNGIYYGDVLKTLGEIEKQVPECVKAYYLEHVIAVRTGDFETALEKLHQFFDYSAVHSQKSMRHYAPLHLAILHTQFNHMQEAHKYLNEAISVARYVKDQECLAHCLNLAIRLQNLSDKSTQPSFENTHHKDPPADLLESLVSSGEFLKMSNLQEEGELGKVDLLVRQGQGKEHIFEVLKRARLVLNSTSGGGPDDGQSLSGEDGMAIVNSCASVWNAFGHSTVADLHMKSHEGITRIKNLDSIEDVVKGLALQAEKQSLNGNEPQATALLSKAKLLTNMDDIHASRLLLFVEKKCEFRKTLNQNVSHIITQSLLSQLIAMANSSGTLEWILESKFLECQMLKQQGQLDAAFDKTNSLIQEAKQLKRDSRCIPYLLLLADMHLSQDSLHAALSLLLSTITLSKAYSQYQQTRNAYVMLSRFYMRSGMVERAIKTIEGVIGAVLVHGDAMERGRALQTLTECRVAGMESAGNTKNGYSVGTLLKIFNAAYAAYESVYYRNGMRKIMYIKAQFLHSLGPGYELAHGDILAELDAATLASRKKNMKSEKRYEEIAAKERQLFQVMYPSAMVHLGIPFEGHVFPELYSGSDLGLSFLDGEQVCGLRFRDVVRVCKGKKDAFRKDSVWVGWVGETEKRLRIEVAHLIAGEKDRARRGGGGKGGIIGGNGGGRERALHLSSTLSLMYHESQARQHLRRLNRRHLGNSEPLKLEFNAEVFARSGLHHPNDLYVNRFACKGKGNRCLDDGTGNLGLVLLIIFLVMVVGACGFHAWRKRGKKLDEFAEKGVRLEGGNEPVFMLLKEMQKKAIEQDAFKESAETIY
ncbi:UNVERIFIED_CONTAM: Anaphase-promoting complex subunit 5 [Siphonaria sp. JEL0065]|nr:Anaphase-promoting complex subunit 5 [Siphonaria sp. JEL0065]